MQIIYSIFYLLISLKLVKWHNWKQYYPTVLFMVIGNLLYSFMFKDYPMWRYEHTFEKQLLPTRMSIDLLKSFVSFPLLTLIFLSYLPEEKGVTKKGFYIIFWTLIFGLIEFISKKFGMISYHNTWNMWWSLFFDFVMFSIVSIHYKRPIIAWILAGVFTFLLWELFDISFLILEK